MRQEILDWADVDRLIDVLIPQFQRGFDGMLLITRGGLIPGGLLAEALDIKYILTAAVDFHLDVRQAKLLAWPEFHQFPEDRLLTGRRFLVVDDVWGSGRTITAVKGRVEAARGYPELCVLHYNPYRSLFTKAKPDYYASITDAHIVYPWEVDRGTDKIPAGGPDVN